MHCPCGVDITESAADSCRRSPDRSTPLCHLEPAMMRTQLPAAGMVCWPAVEGGLVQNTRTMMQEVVLAHRGMNLDAIPALLHPSRRARTSGSRCCSCHHSIKPPQLLYTKSSHRPFPSCKLRRPFIAASRTVDDKPIRIRILCSGGAEAWSFQQLIDPRGFQTSHLYSNTDLQSLWYHGTVCPSPSLTGRHGGTSRRVCAKAAKGVGHWHP